MDRLISVAAGDLRYNRYTAFTKIFLGSFLDKPFIRIRFVVVKPRIFLQLYLYRRFFYLSYIFDGFRDDRCHYPPVGCLHRSHNKLQYEGF